MPQALSYVSLVDPPYVAIVPWRDAPPPLGSVALVEGRAGAAALDQLIRFDDSAPWCTTCLLHGSSADGRVLLHVAKRLWPSVVAIETDSLSVMTEAVKAAALACGSPTFTQIATYAAQRLNAPQSTELILESLQSGSRGDPTSGRSRRTLDRHMRSLGSMSVRDWRVFAGIVRALASYPPPSSVERLAWSAGFDPRTFRGYCREFTGLLPHNALELIGWKWIVEAMLRRQGYFSAENCSRPGVSDGRERVS